MNMRWAMSCAQALPAKLGDDDCLVAFAVDAGWTDSSEASECPSGVRSVMCFWGSLQVSGLVFL